MTRHSTPWIVALVLVGALLVGAVWWSGRSGEATPGGMVSADGAPVGSVPKAWAPAADVLRAWDRSRARAYARADAAALRGLYTPGSGAGVADLRLIRRYRSRGYRVVGMRMQLLSLDVLDRRADRWRVAVTDRLDSAVAVGHGQRLTLPRDRASARVITLQRGEDGSWRVAAVREGSR